MKIPVYNARYLNQHSRLFLDMAADTRQYSGSCDNIEHVERMLAKLAVMPEFTHGTPSLDDFGIESDFNTKSCKGNKALLTNSGTSATHFLYKALKFKLPKLKCVLVPSNSYVAVYNSILYDQDGVALIPILSSSCRAAGEFVNIDYDDLEQLLDAHNPEETAIMVVHNLGNPVDVNRIHKMSEGKFLIVEDNCEGFGGGYIDPNTKKIVATGTNCLASSVSFYGNKNITCGEGGAVITKDSELYDYLKCLRGQGESQEKWVHSHLGYNYRMSNFNASVLRGELCGSRDMFKRKKEIFEHYDRLFRYYYPACEISTITKDVLGKEGLTNSKWMYAVGISQPVANELRDHLGRFGIETRPMFHNIYKHEHINPYSGMSTKRFNNLIEADEILQKSVVVLPSGPTLTEGEIEFIGTKVNEFAQEVHVSNF
jgi:perosamine synthetase